MGGVSTVGRYDTFSTFLSFIPRGADGRCSDSLEIKAAHSKYRSTRYKLSHSICSAVYQAVAKAPKMIELTNFIQYVSSKLLGIFSQDEECRLSGK